VQSLLLVYRLLGVVACWLVEVTVVACRVYHIVTYRLDTISACKLNMKLLQAAWKAVTAGGMPVKHMGGGVYGWYSSDLPMYGEYDKSNLGRTPNAAVEPKGQYYEEAQKALEQKRQQDMKK